MLVPLKPCTSPGCHNLSKAGKCDDCRKKQSRKYDSDRDSTQYWRKWVHSHQYRKALKIFNANNPFCAQCEREGKVTPGELMHHKIPHNGNYELFWDESNWERLCFFHHELAHPNRFAGNPNNPRSDSNYNNIILKTRKEY